MKIRTPPLGIETRKATFTPSTINAEKRTVELVWSTGAKVLRTSWGEGQFYEELDMKGVKLDRLNNGAPFLADHDGYNALRVYGVVESARVANGQGVAVVRFDTAENDPDADKLFRKIANGIVQNVSVGYRTHKIEKVAAEGEKIPTYRVTSWTPFEISAVAMGADDGAGFRSTSTNKEQGMFKRQKFQQQEDGAGGGGSPSSEITRVERQRCAGIMHAVRAAGLEPKFAERLIEGGVALDQARNQIIDELAKRSDEIPTESHVRGDYGSGARITGGETAGEKFVRGASAWIFEKAGISVVEQAKKRGVKGFEKVDLDGAEFRGMSMLDIARESLERNGVRTRGMSRQNLIGAALTTRAGSGDFPILLEDAMGKVLLGAYAIQDDTWSKFCKTEMVPDFRASPRYRVGSFGTLPVVPEFGEYEDRPIPDGSKLSIATETRGGIINLSRQALINDDLSSFADLATRHGRSAKLTIESEVYALLAQNSGLGPTVGSNPFFHSSNGNVGTSSALSVTGIDEDATKMNMQQDISGNDYLDLRPAILVVHAKLRGAANVVNDSQFDVDAGAALQKPNRVRGLFREVVSSPRVASETRRYLFADPSIAPAIVVAFLEGSGPGPYLETKDGWRVDGTEWKVRIDAKAQMFDPKGAVTNAGT